MLGGTVLSRYGTKTSLYTPVLIPVLEGGTGTGPSTSTGTKKEVPYRTGSRSTHGVYVKSQYQKLQRVAIDLS